MLVIRTELKETDTNLTKLNVKRGKKSVLRMVDDWNGLNNQIVST